MGEVIDAVLGLNLWEMFWLYFWVRVWMRFWHPKIVYKEVYIVPEINEGLKVSKVSKVKKDYKVKSVKKVGKI